MSSNQRPLRRLADDQKKKDADPMMSENATRILESIEKMDTPEKFFNLEDKIAGEMKHDKIYKEFRADYEYLRKAVEDYIEGKPTSTDAIAKVARLRKNTRLCHYATAQMRKEVAEQMEIVDAKLLQLQNVTSEVQHIQKEIDRCLEFSAGDEDIELVSVEEFYKLAPESLSRPDETMGDEHEQYLARLQFEHDQRKELLSTLQELEGRRNVLQSDIRGKEVRLQKLKPKLDDLAKVAEPCFEIVGAKFKDLKLEEEQQQLSLSLPTPLAVAHIHATAYKEIHEDKQFDFRIAAGQESTKAPKEEAETKRRRKDDQSTQEKIREMAAKMLEVHPTSLEFDIESSNDEFKITMVIQYLPELKVTTAKWQIPADSHRSKKSVLFSPDTLMSDLFEGDSGDKCPNNVGELKVEYLKMNFDSTAKQIGKPYKFMQTMSGLDGETGGVAITEHFRKVIKAIRERISHRFALDSIIKSLESKKTEGDSEGVKINSFKQCDDENFIASIPMTLSELISKSGNSDRFSFKAELEDSHGKKLTAFLSIPADYPRRTTLFGIVPPEGSNPDSVKEIEDRLNQEADYVDDFNSLKDQMNILMKHVDIS